MTGTREAIFAEVATRLEAIVPPEGRVEREPSADPDVFPYLGVIDDGHDILEFEAGTTRYELQVTIAGYVEASGGGNAHAQLNQLYEDSKAALLTEPPLGGLAETIDEGSMSVVTATLASARRLAFSLALTIVFSTERGAAA